MRDVKRDLIGFFVESVVKSGVGQFFLRFLYHAELDARTQSGRVISLSQWPLRTQYTHKYKKRTSMPSVGSEITIPAFRWMQTTPFTTRPLYIRFLEAFAKMRKFAISFVMPLSVCMELLVFPLDGFT
jgi:hypothetical protein